MRKAMGLLEKEQQQQQPKKETAPTVVTTSLAGSMRPPSKDRKPKQDTSSSADFKMSKSGGIAGYKRNPQANLGVSSTQKGEYNNSDILAAIGGQKGASLDNEEQYSGISTAMSNNTSSRMGSSGEDKGKNLYKRGGSGNNHYNNLSAANFEDSKDEQQPTIYELSLTTNKIKTTAKPQKLKPLVGKQANLAKSLLEDDPKPSYMEGLNEKVSAEIDSDMKSYLDPTQIFKQLKSAFDPNSKEKEYASPSLSKTMVHNRRPGSTQPLEPIQEENQLVGTGFDLTGSKARSKKIEQLLSKVKKFTGQEKSENDKPLALPQPPSKPKPEEATFITGGGIKGQIHQDEDLTDAALLRQYEEIANKDENFGKKKKKKADGYYDMADELIGGLDDTEKEMNDMLKYLQEMQDFIRNGEDVQSIESMIEVTKDTMVQHIEAYDKFKVQIDQINEQAENAIKLLNFYDNDKDDDTRSVISSTSSVGLNRANFIKGGAKKSNLERVHEDSSDSSSGSDDSSSEGSYEGDGIFAGSNPDRKATTVQPKKKSKGSLEENKSGIVKKLLGMNNQMRDFTKDVESRLDKAYQYGAAKKFGYDDITNQSQMVITASTDRQSIHEDRVLNKIQNQAQSYIENNRSITGSSKTSHLMIEGIPSGNMSNISSKASLMLPPMLKNAVDTLSLTTSTGAPALKVKTQQKGGSSVKRVTASHNLNLKSE